MNKNSLKLAKEWFDKAQADIDFARLGFKETEHYGEVCFLCQQAAEKYLKGFLVAHFKEPAKIHSCAALAQECSKVSAQFKNLLDDCKTLDRYYIPPRYPVGIPADFTKTDARQAIDIAEEIFHLVKKLISL